MNHRGDYQKEFWETLNKVWLEARQNYLNQAHTKEDEVFIDGYKNEWFFLDGVKVYIPEHLTSARRYLKYLK